MSQQDVYSSGFTPTQTVELQSMFQKCGFQGADWVDIPAWLMFTTQIAEGAVLAGQKQSVGSSQGADFYLRRIQTINAGAPTGGTTGPKVYMRILCPNGHYLQSGNPSLLAFTGAYGGAVPAAGTLTPGPLGLIKPEERCPAGSNFTIDLLNITPAWAAAPGSITVSIIFEGVYRFRLEKACG